MSTGKHIDRICILAVVAALLISLLFMNGATLGIQTHHTSMGYEDRLFDTAKVHTLDIVIDDWEGFLSTAQSEQYTVCDVVIDGEAFNNVGIRGKGNTSLSTVSSMNSDRYSFKIEFDQYDSTKSYYGLDKLSLNNLIQDNTMMKDYLVYQMMGEFGAAAPLCSYVYITVNGQDWGLYLAVEAVEESFLQRNYGNDYGDLYKPDSMNMGGGRGNGKDFDVEEFMESFGTEDASGGMMPNGGMWPGMDNGSSQPSAMPEGFDPSQMGGMQSGGTGNIPQKGGNMGGFDPSQMGGFDFSRIDGFDFPQMGDMGGMGSDETKLQYIDDDPDSYSTIFSSAKTDVTAADQTRLIASLKALSQGDESAVDAEAVIRYFVVHNFVVNEDSYTGSMVHNYYLYEEDGQLSMIPWDYNLAFGTFQGNSANNAVNDDIDAPLSVTGTGRPMIDWILSSEENTDLYHRYFQEFLDTVDAQSIISQAKELIAPYVEKDPTKFCTYEDFETGAETLAAFCLLRTQSVAQQLAGEQANVDASAINLSDMGTMGGGFGGMQRPSVSGGDTQMPQMPGQSGDMGSVSGMEGKPGGNFQFPGFSGQGNMGFSGGMQMPDGMQMPGGNTGQNGNMGGFSNGWQGNTNITQGGNQTVVIAVTVVILIAGLLFAIKYKR